MKPIDVVAEALKSEGVEVVFTLADEVTVFAVHRLDELGVRVVHVRHEQNALLMADGYSRATGKPGVCLVGHGPAIAQTGTALVTGKKKGSQVLVLIGRAAQSARPGEPKEFDERRFVEATGSAFLSTNGPRRLGESLSEGFRRVRLGGGPVVVRLPAREDLIGDLEGLPPYRAATSLQWSLNGPDPELPVIEELAARLINAKRPIFLAGLGALKSGATEDIVRLADLCGALLATSLQARNLFDDHRRNIGIIGTFATEPVAELLAQSDLILVLGASLNPNQSGGGRLASGAQIVQVDVNPAQIGAMAPVDVGVVGDVAGVVRAVHSAISSADLPSALNGWAGERQRALISAAAERPAAKPADSPGAREGRMYASAFLKGINALLPEDRFVVVDGGFFMNFVVDQIDVPRPSEWLWTLDFASIGLGLGMGLGAAVGTDGKTCVLFVGDGGLAMSLQELETAARERIPLVIVVMNDGTYMSEVMALRSANMSTGIVGLGDVDFASIASSFGIPSVSVCAESDLAAVAPLLQDQRGPVLIDARVDEDEEHRQRVRYG